MKSALAGCTIGAVAAVALLASVSPDPGARAGQTVFVPVRDLPPSEIATESRKLEVASCAETREGLLVRGRVWPADGIHEVWVASGEDSLPGVRVGSATLADAARRFEVGDFRVTLPWASQTARFALVLPEGRGPSLRGPILTCPRGAGTEG